MRKAFFLLLCSLLCSLCLLTHAAEEKASDATLEPSETITESVMNERLQLGGSEDLLYVKTKNDTVEVYSGLAESRSLRKQLVLSLPDTVLVRFYTNNKATYEQLYKMLSDYERDNTNFNGYRLITDKDSPRKLENDAKIYRFWCMKMQREKKSRGGIPIGIGVGIGIGGGHHHHHHGRPWIGIGW